MTVYRPKGRRTFRYDFELEGRRHFGNTKQTTRKDAELFESDLKLKLRREGANIAPRPLSPHFSRWAEVYFDYVVKREKPKRPDSIEHELRVVLRFLGAKPSGKNPKNPIVDGEPYHDLRLKDLIDDPKWLVRFEEWMDTRGVAGTTKNHYRSRVSRMFAVAMHPLYRQVTGITANPFIGIPRDRQVNRTVTLSKDQVLTWLAATSFHTGLAVAIAALAPMLRLENILSLKWNEHVDKQLRFITVPRHKTEAATGAPLVTPISAQLRVILKDARRKRRGDYVVSYRGEPVKSIRDGLMAAAERAGISYGRFKDDGATFHTLRHTAATILAETGMNAWQQQSAMGWKSIATAQKYTHLRPMHLKGPIEQLSKALPIARTVTRLRRRATSKKKQQAKAG